jgi:hypothetical protein
MRAPHGKSASVAKNSALRYIFTAVQQQGVRAMLAEWIKNISQSLLDEITANSRVQNSRIWILACEERQRRRASLSWAA